MEENTNVKTDTSPENAMTNNIEVEEMYEKISTDHLYDFVDNDVPSFVRLSDKYNDIISSASTMLFVGIAGLLFMILVFAEIIPLPLSSETAWLFNTIMGGVFIIFIVAGIVSFMHAKQVKIDAEEEDNLIKNILSWADENLTIQQIDNDLDLSQSMELLYFNRADKIKEALMHEFENADESLIYEYTEQIYQKLYETAE